MVHNYSYVLLEVFSEDDEEVSLLQWYEVSLVTLLSGSPVAVYI